jgi:hypothetical protein
VMNSRRLISASRSGASIVAARTKWWKRPDQTLGTGRGALGRGSAKLWRRPRAENALSHPRSAFKEEV